MSVRDPYPAVTCAHPPLRRICRDNYAFCDLCGTILSHDPPSHSREEPAGLSDPAPATGGPAAMGVGPAAGSGDMRVCIHGTGWGPCSDCDALDPAAPPPPPAASISRAAAEEAAGSLEAEATAFGEFCARPSLVEQAEAVGIRGTPGALQVALDAVAELRQELGIALMAFADGARVSALALRLDQSSEAWTLGVAHLTERVRAQGDELRVLKSRLDAVEPDLEAANPTLFELAHSAVERRVTDLLADAHRDAKPPNPPGTSAELAALRERIRSVVALLEAGHFEAARVVAGGVS